MEDEPIVKTALQGCIEEQMTTGVCRAMSPSVTPTNPAASPLVRGSPFFSFMFDQMLKTYRDRHFLE